MKSVYLNPRPILIIEQIKSVKAGNYYYITTYKITSKNKLSTEQINLIRSTGLIGYGQSFIIKSEQIIEEEVSCVIIDDDGKVIGPSINPYTRKPDLPIKSNYYIYEIEDVCDSSD